GGAPVNGGGQYFGFGFDPNIPMSVLITRQSGVWHYFVDGVNWDVLTQPTFLNTMPDLFAGVHAQDVGNGVHKTISVDQFIARVFDPPSVKATPGGGNLTVTWNVAGATLQSNTNLLNPAGWTTVTTTSPYVIPQPKTGTLFYRTVQ